MPRAMFSKLGLKVFGCGLTYTRINAASAHCDFEHP
jgi:hypothetical protein